MLDLQTQPFGIEEKDPEILRQRFPNPLHIGKLQVSKFMDSQTIIDFSYYEM